jgi:hypothetical protein
MIAYSDSLRLDLSGGRTTMDKVTESLLAEFSKNMALKV